MTESQLFVGALAILLATSVAGLLTGAQQRLAGVVNLIGTAIAAVLMAILAGKALASGPVSFTFANIHLLGLNSDLAFRIDGLSAIFVLIIAVLSTLSSIFSISYLDAYVQADCRRYYVPFPLFIGGMFAVATTSDWFWFFVAWEFMTLASYFLVTYRNREQETLSAGFIYFMYTQATSMGLMVAVIVLGNWGGSTSFDAMSALAADLAKSDPLSLNIVLVLFFIGFATKAGMFPLSRWLPRAYPVSPASVTALLSGVMSKLGVYGLFRVFLWQLPASSFTHNWGVIITTLGVISMVVGSIRALAESDYKRLVSQSSIGQMGYIFMGLGMGMAFLDSNPLFAMVALLGTLYHILNHASFKSLLFFNTGALLFRTGTRDLDRLGGLKAIMPLTAICALIGALSIAGTPPANGFISKWLLYQSAIFGGPTQPIYAIYGVLAIFIGTVTLAYGLKYMGTAYLGTLPERFQGAPKGSPFAMELVQVILCIVCILLGLFPQIVVSVLLGVIHPVLAKSGVTSVEAAFHALPWAGASISFGTLTTGYGPIIVGVSLLGCMIVVFGIQRLVKVNKRPAEIWNCGEYVHDEMVRYRALSFYRPFIKMVEPIVKERELPSLAVPKAYVKGADMDNWFYFPIGRFFARISGGFSKIHNGVPQNYLVWQVLGCTAAVGLVFWLM